MMGPTHALSGGVAFLAVAMPLSEHVHPLTPATVVVGMVVAAGAAMLPDTDHPRGTIANAFGPISMALCKLVAAVSGGHRKATHSFIGAAAFVGLATASTLDPNALAVTLWLCIGLAVRSLWRRPKNRPNGKLDYKDVAGLIHAGIAAYVAYRIAISSIEVTVVPWAVAIGYLAHLVGDSLTERGVPWLWPSRRRYRVGSIDTGKKVEMRVVVPALYVTLAVIAVSTHSTWVPTVFPSR